MASFRWLRIGFVLLALLVVLGTASAVHSQEAAEAGVIYLQARTFDPVQDSAVAAAGVETAQVNGDGLGYYLVQFDGPVQQVWTQQVAALGGQVLGYVPDNTHVVRMRPEQAINVATLPAVRWVGPYL